MAYHLTGIEERFWSKVDKGGPVPEHVPHLGPCWVWIAKSRLHGGYGVIKLPRQRQQVVSHRVSWEMHVGSIPDGLYVLHKCDNPPCVRPAHLFLGTDLDNTADKVAKGRSARLGRPLPLVCQKEHVRTAENTQILPNGRRLCLICAQIRTRKKAVRRNEYVKAARTACRQRHAYSEHGYLDTRGWRRCSICQPGGAGRAAGWEL